jgi:glycosyltransferase involved in cell wall biosynthesis
MNWDATPIAPLSTKIAATGTPAKYEYKVTLNQVLASRTWRVTRPLRFAGRLLRGEWPVARAGLQSAFVEIARSIYRLLPLSRTQKRWRASSENKPEQPRLPGNCSVLVIDHKIPEPDRDAGSRSMFHIMEALVDAQMDVKFFPVLPTALDSFWRKPQYVSRLQEIGIDVYRSRFPVSFRSWLRKNGQDIDYVILSRPNVAINFIGALRKYSHAKLLFYGHDIHHLRLRERTKIRGSSLKSKAKARKIEEMERRIWSMVDVIYYPSDQETAYVKAISPNYQARTIPLLGFRDFASPEDGKLSTRRDILFVAGFAHEPNEDAALWFVKMILPVILKRKPTARIWLVGSNPTPKIRDLASDPSIAVTGFVTDEQLAAYYANARVAVAPLRYGAGMKGKVIEAMRFGVPIVTTPCGVQGMTELETKLPIYLDPVAFAEAVLTLLIDNTSWRSQRRIQSEYVRRHFSHDALRDFLAADIARAC